MPIYEYQCTACRHVFDELVKVDAPAPACPSCGGSDVERLISLPAVSTEKTRRRTTAEARQRGDKMRQEKARAQAEYERNYIKDHS